MPDVIDSTDDLPWTVAVALAALEAGIKRGEVDDRAVGTVARALLRMERRMPAHA